MKNNLQTAALLCIIANYYLLLYLHYNLLGHLNISEMWQVTCSCFYCTVQFSSGFIETFVVKVIQKSIFLHPFFHAFPESPFSIQFSMYDIWKNTSSRENALKELIYLQSSDVGSRDSSTGSFMLNRSCYHSSWRRPCLKMPVEGKRQALYWYLGHTWLQTKPDSPQTQWV